MSSPNEPGHPGPGEGSGNGSGTGNGAADRSAATGRTAPTPRITDSGELPPWQRGASRTQQSGPVRPQPPADPPTARVEQRPPSPSPAADNRVNRYITGTAAPSALQTTPSAQPVVTPDRSDPARSMEYASEIPDLSGPLPRPPQQRRVPERADTGPVGTARTPGAGRVQVASRAKSGPVRASMQIRRIDPWSTLKVSLLLSVALFFVWMIAVAFLYLVLGGMGVWSKLNSNVGDLLTSTGGSGGELVSSGTIFGGALLIGLVNIVLLTAMATIGAFIYNLTTDIVGGVEVTLADRD